MGSMGILLEIAKVMANARFGFILVLASGVYILWLCCGTLGEASGEVDAFVPPLGFHFLTSLMTRLWLLPAVRVRSDGVWLSNVFKLCRRPMLGRGAPHLKLGVGRDHF